MKCLKLLLQFFTNRIPQMVCLFQNRLIIEKEKHKQIKADHDLNSMTSVIAHHPI